MSIESFKEVFRESDIDILFDSLIKSPELIDYAFNIACGYDDYYVIRGIYDMKEYMDISDGFVSSCGAGHINIIKKLLDLKKDIREEKYDEGLYCACVAGQLEVFKYILQLRPNILQRVSVYEKAYVNAVFSCNLELVKEIKKYKYNK